MPELHLITIYAPGEAPKRYDLDQFQKEIIWMGKGPYHGTEDRRNDIQIDPAFSFVSKAHCYFQRDRRGNWYIIDDGSMNGVLFNGQKVPYHRLNDGDQLYIGHNVDSRLVVSYSCRNEELETDKSSMMHFPLRDVQRCVIGRANDCDIIISHPMVSRKHCIITRENGKFYIADNQSTNGVLLNSRMLQKKEPLKPMDRINIGGTSIIFNGEYLYYSVQGGGVGIVVEHVCKRVGKRKAQKTIADDISLTIRPNSFVAIIGGSGAGKTTLLNCISGMSTISSGDVLINGESIRTGGKNVRSLLGYVPQQDIVYDSLSLERMLMYSAKLRMPPDTSEKEIQDKIKETLQIVELTEHRHTMISKLSGGQKKRASIAVELLASPKVFFLDEPSSGLDPGTEKHLMQMLKRLSMTGKTVVMVTHTVQNIDLCDTVICMGKGGRLCYSGDPTEVLRFFGKKRMTDVYDELNDHSKTWAEKYKQDSNRGDEPNVAKESVETPKRSGAQLRQFRVMTARYVEILFNSKLRLIFLLAMPVLLTLLVCMAFDADGNFHFMLYKLRWSWAQQGAGFLQKWVKGMVTGYKRATFPFLQASDTVAFLFAFSCAVFWIGIFNSIQEISKERPIYQRERFSGVGIAPYILSKYVPLAVLCLVQSAIMTAVMMPLIHTTATISGSPDLTTAWAAKVPSDGLVLGTGMMWLETFVTTYLSSLTAMCIGLVISTLVSNEMAMVLCPICLLPQILFSGVVVKLTGITKAIADYIVCRWSCIGYLVSTRINDLYEKVQFSTDVVTKDANTGMIVQDLSAPHFVGTLNDLGFNYDKLYSTDHKFLFGQNGVLSAWIALAIMSLVCIAAAIIILRFKRSKTR